MVSHLDKHIGRLPYLNRNLRFNILAVLLLLLIIVGGSVAYFAQLHSNNALNERLQAATQQNNMLQAQVDAYTKFSIVKPSLSDTGHGTIVGDASYPSEGLPPEEEVCALSAANLKTTYCENVGQKQTVGFAITVPAGYYYLYAVVNNHKAYYDAYSLCGYYVDCPKTLQNVRILLHVANDQIVSNTNPGDWY